MSPKLLCCLAALLVSLPARAAENDNDILFGSKEKGSAGLIAIIYDLKQTQDRKESNVNAQEYIQVVKEFIRTGWDEMVLNRYFRVTAPLYSSQIFIPGMSAHAAPEAYGVDRIMQPSCWVIHYKGQVSPPEDGTYRFVGYADDILAVAVNGKTVCIGARNDMQMREVWKSPEPEEGAYGYNGSLTYGEWIEMKKGEPIDLDVLVGERPGGEFCAFLMWQKQGASYAKNGSNKLILPVFQLASQPIPGKPEGDHDAPPYVPSAPLWQQHQ